MQPARADVVRNLTLPASAATASERLVAMMSLPSCAPLPRGAPKSSVYMALPTTGKTSCGTFAAVVAAVARRTPEGEQGENEKSSGCRPVAGS